MALALKAEYVQACSFMRCKCLDKLMYKSLIFYTKICTYVSVKSSQVDEFKNDRQMFAFLRAE